MQEHKYRATDCSVYSSTLPGTGDVQLQGKHHSQLGRFGDKATHRHLKHTEAIHRAQALCPVVQRPVGKNLMSSLCLHFLLVLPGNTNSIFALDYISGALTLNGPLDRENPFYSSGFILTVKVSFWRPHGAGGKGTQMEVQTLALGLLEASTAVRQHLLTKEVWYSPCRMV